MSSRHHARGIDARPVAGRSGRARRWTGDGPDGRAPSRRPARPATPCCRARRRCASQSSGRSPPGPAKSASRSRASAARSRKVESGSMAVTDTAATSHPPSGTSNSVPSQKAGSRVDAATGHVAAGRRGLRRIRRPTARCPGGARLPGRAATSFRAASPESMTRGRPVGVGKAMLPHPVRAQHPAGHRPDGDPRGDRRRRTDRPHADDPDQAHGRLAGLLDRQFGGSFQDQGGRAVLAVEECQRRPFGDHPADRQRIHPAAVDRLQPRRERGDAQARGTGRIEPEQVRRHRQ